MATEKPRFRIPVRAPSPRKGAPDGAEWQKHLEERRALQALAKGLFAASDDDEAPPPLRPQQLAEAGAEQGQPSHSFHIPNYTWECSGRVAAPPPLRPGEKRVLSTTLTARQAARYERVVAASRANKKLASVRAVLSEDDIQEHERKQLEANIGAFILAGSPHSTVAAALGDLPTELPCPATEVFPVDPDDARRGLAAEPGALGVRVRAGRAVRRLDVLGVYSGLQMDSEELVRFKSDALLALHMDALPAELATKVDCYCCDLVHVAAMLREEEQKEYPEAKALRESMGIAVLHISAWGYGNEMANINDAVIAPFNGLYLKSYDSELVSDFNCTMMEVFVHGWPFVFLVAQKDLQPGEEILLRYGPEYWMGLSNAMAQAEASREVFGRLQRARQAVSRAAGPANGGAGTAQPRPPSRMLPSPHRPAQPGSARKKRQRTRRNGRAVQAGYGAQPGLALERGYSGTPDMASDESDDPDA